MAFDPQVAAAALVDSLGAQTLAKAAAYTAGKHWLLLWNLVVTGLAAWAIVRSRLLDRVDARMGRRGVNARAFVVGVVFFLAMALLTLPWDLYATWWRERDYGRTSQPLADFLGQSALGNLISAVLGALFFVGVYALIRRTGARWWLWSGGLTAITVSALMLAAPVSDPRGLPVMLFLVALISVLATPVMSTLNRMSESEVDRHSLETVNLPDALATALVKTAEYRDPRPNPVQEFLFYTHPAVERRVLAAMRWKAEGH